MVFPATHSAVAMELAAIASCMTGLGTLLLGIAAVFALKKGSGTSENMKSAAQKKSHLHDSYHREPDSES
jgi:hypothetical protein